MKKVSLFTRFTILIITATFTLVVSTHIALHAYFSYMRANLPIHDVFLSHSRFVAAQFDMKDTVSALRLLREQGMDMRYKSDSFQWSSSSEIADFDIMEKRSDYKPVLWYRNHLTCAFQTDSASYIFQVKKPFLQLRFPWELLIVWSVILVIVFGLTHLYIRHLLKPLRILHNGVKQISRGDFEIELPKKSSDELGQLIQSFNDMARHIRNDLKARDQLLRDISHELRSPLARILVALEFIPEGNIRQTIKNNISTLDKMTGAILEEARLDSPFGKVKLEKIDLGSLLSEIQESRKQSAPSVQLCSTAVVEVEVDKERMKMALSNLIDNAIKYSKPEGEPVKVAYASDGKWVKIVVSDSGIGISEKELPFIFEPFYRVDKARRYDSGGYGLGMSLTKKIVEAHGGQISIESSQDIGTTVTIVLPCRVAEKKLLQDVT